MTKGMENNMAFETFVRKRSVTKEPRVTVLKQGNFNLNCGAMKILKEQSVTHLQLLHDKESHRIAFKPCAPAAPGAYALHPTKGMGLLAGVSFLKCCNIPFGGASRSFPAVWDGTQGLLVVSLGEKRGLGKR
jgi:hypothetical protein